MLYDATWLDNTGRLLIVLSFLVSGLYNLTQTKEHIERIAAFHVPFPAVAFWIGMTLQFIGCALLITGWHAEIGALCLIVFTVTATAIYHRFWSKKKDAMQRTASRLALIGNISVVGGLLLLLQNLR